MSRSPVAFGQYVITRRIARGGMAEIYRAKRRSAGEVGKGQWVALKMMRPSLEHEELREQLFKREAKIASAIDHANVIPLFEFGRELDRYYIAMEYLRGRDLSHLIRGEDAPKADGIPMELALYVGLRAASGLGHAHRLSDPTTGEALQIVHRDISPGNVMIGYDGAVKVLDFGVARMSESHGLRTQTGTLRGKFAYMSPEQTIGAPIDARSDVFSLGTLLYELLTGTNPFRARTPIATLERVQRVRPVPPSRSNRKIEREIDELLARCLAKDPRRRFRDAGELEDALGDYLERKGLIDQERLARFMADRFVWERQEEEKELKEEEEEVALIEVVDFALRGDDQGLDARHVAVSLEEEAEKPAVASRTEDSSPIVAEEEQLGVFDVDSETVAQPSRFGRPAAPLVSPPPMMLSGVLRNPGSVSARASNVLARALHSDVAISAPFPESDEEPSHATIAQPNFGWSTDGSGRALEASSLLEPGALVDSDAQYTPAHTSDTRPETDPLIAALKEGRQVSPLEPSLPASRDVWRRTPIAGIVAGVVALVASGAIFAFVAADEPPATLDVGGPTKIAPITIKLDAPGPERIESIPPPRKRAARPKPAEKPAETPPEQPAEEKAELTAARPAPAAAPAELPAIKHPARAAEEAPAPARAPAPRAEPRDDDRSERREARQASERRRSRRAVATTGFLNVGAKPWAEIEIDGKPWPYQTPQAGIELSTGRHVVKLHNRETGVTKTAIVQIKPGAYKTVSEDMRKP